MKTIEKTTHFVLGAKVQGLTVYVDGSGADAVVSFGRFAWAFNTLGDVRSHGVRVPAASTHERAVAYRVCERAYVAARDAVLPPGWRELNGAMYAGDGAAL